MKLELGEFEFDLGKECQRLEVLLPFSLEGGRDLNAVIVMEQLMEDEVLNFYSCGDILSTHGMELAGGLNCDDTLEYKITICFSAGDEVDEYVAVACRGHAMVLVYQMLFMLGIRFGSLAALDDGDEFIDDNDEEDE